MYSCKNLPWYSPSSNSAGWPCWWKPEQPNERKCRKRERKRKSSSAGKSGRDRGREREIGETWRAIYFRISSCEMKRLSLLENINDVAMPRQPVLYGRMITSGQSNETQQRMNVFFFINLRNVACLMRSLLWCYCYTAKCVTLFFRFSLLSFYSCTAFDKVRLELNAG